MPKKTNNQQIFGIYVDSTSLVAVLSKVAKEDKLFLVSVNPEYIVTAQEDNEFKNILNSADIRIPDGYGLRFVIPNLCIIPGRKLVEEFVKTKYKIFYLGGKDNESQKMAEKFGGAWDVGLPTTPDQTIIDKINKYKPDILLVAYKYPMGEKWLFANCQKLNARVVMAVGGSFRYLTGMDHLPPVMIEKMGLEWLWRLILQPWRLKRQMKILQFMWMVLLSRISYQH